MIVTTTPSIEGKSITDYHGIVVGAEPDGHRIMVGCAVNPGVDRHVSRNVTPIPHTDTRCH